MTSHRYPKHTIVPDYIRASVGGLLTWGPFTAIPANSAAGVVLSLLGILFIIFAGRTWVRGRTNVQSSEEGLAVTALRSKMILWQDIASLELRYFATKRDRSEGWMQLTLKSTDATLRLESAMEGFESITRAAARAAARRGLPLSPSTQENLRALELPTDHLTERSPEMNQVR
ncbi:MAG: hypothetical protein O3C49_04320 [Proteobacteria bacterium]|nr:hypothetical protein [Pseudomonadota bacterium]MDA1323446.1 hypothetical protein [Pseudomonadota bacterium]